MGSPVLRSLFQAKLEASEISRASAAYGLPSRGREPWDPSC
jgi:hypothetical protein